VLIDFADNEVILVDISLPPAAMRELGYNHSVTWIDHHASAIRDSIDNAYTIYKGLRDPLFAACELTWKYLFPEKDMPEIVRLLGRYDCFGHKGTDEELTVLRFQYGARAAIANTDDAYKYLSAIVNCPDPPQTTIVHTILDNGRAIYKYLCTEAEQIYKRAFIAVFLVHNSGSHDTTYSFLCVNQERFNPINFGIDYHKDGHNGFICFHYGNGKWNFSVYNDNGEVDCSEICKMLGGGGHKGASGFIGTEEFVIKLTHFRRIELIPLKS
jgi:hypothetical protein